MRKALRGRRAEIPELTTRRLSIYLRCLEILDAAGVETISSRELADQFHLNSAQFRKDLAYFGEFGVRGLGYRVAELKSHLLEILGLNRQIRMAIIGAGNLGTALADYAGFNSSRYRVVAIFDTDPAKIGTRSRGGVEVHDVRQLAPLVQKEAVDIAVLAVPAASAQAVLDQAAAAGLMAILNFVPARLKVPAGVRLKSVDLKVQVESLVFHLARLEHSGAAPARTPTGR